jgi:hypothetical protein
VAAGALAGPKTSAISPPPSANCQLANGIKHVIELTFDNVHYNRDNPNVLSDLEQMPHLLNFFTQNGTLLSNNHTPMIAHTADDSLTNYTGLYGDRHGQGIGNSYETFVNGVPTSKSSFAYWTGTYNLDSFPNMPYSANVPAAGAPAATPPAPWVPFTRVGCDVGDVSTANMVLENTNPDLANFFGPNSPEVAQYNADTDSFKDQETNDYLGVGVHCTQNDSFCSTATAVKFGQSSPSATAVTDSLPDEPGGYNGYQALFGHKYLTSQLAQAANSGMFHVVNGHSYQVVDGSGNLTDLNGQTMKGAFSVPGHGFTPGFPGFGPISAAQTLAYMADMQETGVPITYGYISDVHERKNAAGNAQTGCTNPSGAASPAEGPADPCDVQNLQNYDLAFEKFFQRLADDGINKSNTLFILAADEGDHSPARTRTAPCSRPAPALRTPRPIRATTPRWAESPGSASSRCRSTASCPTRRATPRRSTTSPRATPSTSTASPGRPARPRGRWSTTSSAPPPTTSSTATCRRTSRNTRPTPRSSSYSTSSTPIRHEHRRSRCSRSRTSSSP